jgi:hypothetical protein
MLTFTLDTNGILALDDVQNDHTSQRTAEAESVRLLAAAHSAGTVSVGVVAISASEHQRHGGHLENFAVFEQRLFALGVGHLELLLPMLYFDVTFWDASLWSD